MIINKILSTDFAINMLIKHPVGEKLETAIAVIEKIQKYLAVADSKKADNELSEMKAATIAVFAVIRKIQSGKIICQFDNTDWKDVINSISEYVLLLPDTEYSVFIFEMYERCIRTSVESISSFAAKEACDSISELADELQRNAELFHNESIDEAKYTEECLWIALEAMFKLFSTTCVSIIKDDTLSEFVNALTDFAFEYGRFMLYKREQEIISEFIEAQYEIDFELEQKYIRYIEDLNRQTEQFSTLIDNAFAPSYRDAFLKSILLAQMTGVEENQILKNREDIDKFFLD